MANLNLKHGLGDKVPGPGESSSSSESAGEVLKRLDQLERTTGRSGAVSRTPKGMMLDMPAAKYQTPDNHLRWVNISQTDKATNAVEMGYSPVKDEKGDMVTTGNLQLWSCPKDYYEDRAAMRREQTAEKLGFTTSGERRDSAEFYNHAEKLKMELANKGVSSSTLRNLVNNDPKTSG
jgi:hypothetical protein